MKGDGIPLTPPSFPSYQCGKTFLARYQLVRANQLRHLTSVCALHGAAVDGGVRGLPDAVDGEHSGIDGSAIGLETQGGIVEAALRVHLDPPFIELMRHAELDEGHRHRLRAIRE